MIRLCVTVLTLSLLSLYGENEGIDIYLKEIKPVLEERCYACHGVLKQKGKLRVDTVKFMHDKGVIKEGDLLERLITDDEDDKMPPEGEPLKPEQIEAIKKWIKAGAPAPKDEKAEEDPRNHWAFKKIERPEVPKNGEMNPVDAFLKKKLEAERFKPQKVAEKTLLIRRLYLDLIGLPPTEKQLMDKRSISEISNELLESPQYGERWGRHWMDIWRYSDWFGLGDELRGSQKNLWRWRDWIVKSLNNDKGYDRMIHEMLAGDEIAPNDHEVLAATGYLTRSFFKFNRTTWLDDVVEHTGKAFLGLTMNCAKCHDHKYDPIDHKDYYKFRAIFEPYHVRTDALPGNIDYENNGLSRAYDGNLTAPTYLHRRGNDSDPVKSKKIHPGPPGNISAGWSEPVEIKLPVEAWAPGIKDYVQKQLISKAELDVKAAEKALEKLKGDKKETVADIKKAPVGVKEFSDNFKRANPELWTIKGTGWRYQGGLLSKVVATMERSYVKSKIKHPHNFDLTVRFQTTGGNKWKSTGIRFDVDETGENTHTVYTSAFAGGSKVQLFHTVGGRDFYPGDTRTPHPIKLNQEYELNIKVRDDLINVSLDGKFLIAYRLPTREAGSIELLAFDSTADFYWIDVKALAKDAVMKDSSTKSSPIKTGDLLPL